MKTLGKLKTLGLATVLTATALGGSIVVAQSVTNQEQNKQRGESGRGGRGRGFGGMRGDRLFAQLNLNDDQKAKIQQIHASFAERNKPLHEQIRAKRQELRQARQGDTFNESLVAQKLTEMAGIEAKLMGERFRQHQEVLTVLTPEQKAQLEQAKAQFKARRGDRPARGERRNMQ